MSAFKIYKRLMDLFDKGDLIRIRETGEVFMYEASTGGANFSSYLIANVCGRLVEYPRSLHVDAVEKISINGDVIDDFKQYEKK